MAVSILQQFKQVGQHIVVLKSLHHGFISFWKQPIQAVSAGELLHFDLTPLHKLLCFLPVSIVLTYFDSSC